MHLSSILKEYGVDIKKTKLVRHPLNKTDIRDGNDAEQAYDDYIAGKCSFMEVSEDFK